MHVRGKEYIMFNNHRRLYFFLVVSTAGLTEFSSGQLQQCQAFFEEIFQGLPLEESIISSFHAHSELGCGQKCLTEKAQGTACAAFSYMPDNDGMYNCLLSNQTATGGTLVKRNAGGSWVTYGIIETGVCERKTPCQNGGQCIADVCKREGYVCKCYKNFVGKHCENYSDDYDLTFPPLETGVDSYIQTDVVKSNLDQLTFATWFKLSIGAITEYTFISYMVNETPNELKLSFKVINGYTSDFCIDVKQQSMCPYMIPLNDGLWHHLGVSWQSSSGTLNVLVDGTQRVIRSDWGQNQIITGGGTLVIGHVRGVYGVVSGGNLVGELSMLNLWDRALSGTEIEALAQTRNEGNIVAWSQVTTYNSYGDVKFSSPSTANTTNTGLDFVLSLNSSQVGYVLSPGPATPIDKLTVAVWIKSVGQSILISYNTSRNTEQDLSFGVDENDRMIATISGVMVTSSTVISSIANNQWHYLVFTWNGDAGEVAFYLGGYHEGSTITQTNLMGELAAQGDFTLGLTGFTGQVGFLNVWSTSLSTKNIRAMASGGMNVNGDLLAWRDVPRYIVGSVEINEKNYIFYPGYGVVANRSQWCMENSGATCIPIFARMGEGVDKGGSFWRCYCSEALVHARYAYNIQKKSSSYCSNHSALIQIGD